MTAAAPSKSQIEQVRNVALGAHLSPEHEASLQSMGLGLLRPALSEDNANALIAVGLARHAVGGLMLTDAGAYRIASLK